MLNPAWQVAPSLQTSERDGDNKRPHLDWLLLTLQGEEGDDVSDDLCRQVKYTRSGWLAVLLYFNLLLRQLSVFGVVHCNFNDIVVIATQHLVC